MMISKQTLVALLLTTLTCSEVSAFWSKKEVEEENVYGVDRSWPMHYSEWSPLNEERRAAYEEYMKGCREAYGDKGYLCDSNEEDRIEMTLRQPQSTLP